MSRKALPSAFSAESNRMSSVPCLSASTVARMVAVVLLGLAALFATLHFAKADELKLPPLTGRVVDPAGVLLTTDKDRLSAKLAEIEAKAGDQLVVAVIDSLQGDSIEDYANRLFRFWQLGDKQQNNGVLLLVATTERRVRIEVGYGLEGVITDAVAKMIISEKIVPAFSANDLAKGLWDGTTAIAEALKSDPVDLQARAKAFADRQAHANDWDDTITIVIFSLFGVLFIGQILWGHRRSRLRGMSGPIVFTNETGNRNHDSGNNSSSGGFSGGGGSSGGGGASGNW